MIQSFFTILIFLLLTTNVNAQENTNTLLDSIPSIIVPDESKKGPLIFLEQMKPNDVFVLREIAGIYPIILTNNSGQRICVWNDKTKNENPTISPVDSLCECKIYRTQNRIGLGFINKEGDLIKGGIITSWRPIPYIGK